MYAAASRDRFVALAAMGEVVEGSKNIAAYVGVSQPTILKMIHAGEIPAFVVGNKLQVSKSLLDAWLLMRQLHALNAAVGEPAQPKPVRK
jgi:excisionase family DNA binding protein